ncbi:hypothetical protein ACFSL4_16785 [Streptomyces caeni]|uniref:Uncharacterized protein n=1 Tax=Streptomyces caeni TaxID=2307231 RepID=A0ABW4IR49_9ACTN
MTNTTTPARPRVKMSIRVYRVDRHGSVTQDRGTVMSLPHGYEPALEPLSTDPERCRCPIHRAGGDR